MRTDLILAAQDLNTQGVTAWAVKNVIPLILLVIGIGIVASAKKGRMSQNAATMSNVLVGLVVIGAAAAIYTFADGIGDLIFQTPEAPAEPAP